MQPGREDLRKLPPQCWKLLLTKSHNGILQDVSSDFRAFHVDRDDVCTNLKVRLGYFVGGPVLKDEVLKLDGSSEPQFILIDDVGLD